MPTWGSLCKNSKSKGFGDLPRGERVEVRGHRSSTPRPTYLTLGISSIWMFIISFIISFCNKPVHVVNCFPEFCKPLKQINQASWAGFGSLLVEAQVTLWICCSPLRWETVCWDWGLSMWDQTSSPGRHSQNSAVGHPAGVMENCVVWVDTPTYLVTRGEVCSVSSKGDRQ